VLSGGGGVDLIDAGSGDDTVIALGGGRDAVKCGDGVDVAEVDKSDPTRDCEQVLYSYLQGAASQTGDSVRVQVAIPVPRSIVKATLMSGGTPLGTDTVRFRAGIQTLSVALDAAGKSALGKAGSLPLKLRVQIAPPGRAAVKASRRVTLSAK
jgi:hypothetical protein